MTSPLSVPALDERPTVSRRGLPTPVYLRQVRVINWHSIGDRTITVPDNGLLIFGTNGAGKTSLQDAIQFGLFPDETTIRFNAAVAGHSYDRSLKGYVLQGLGSHGRGQPHYLYKQRTTYVALLFEAGTERSVFLVGIDAQPDFHEKRLFRLSGVTTLLDVPLLDAQRLVAPLKEIERWVKRGGGHVYPSVGNYIKDIRAVNGGLPEQWPRLLKSAIGFKEIVDATTFVRKFLEEKTVDHQHLLQTVAGYEDLSRAAKETAGWVRLLADAADDERTDLGRALPLTQQSALTRYRHYRSRHLMYLVGQAVLPGRKTEIEIARLGHAIQHLDTVIADHEASCRVREPQIAQAISSREALAAQIASAGQTQAILLMEQERRTLVDTIEASRHAATQVAGYLRTAGTLPSLLHTPGVQVAGDRALWPTEPVLLSADGKSQVQALLQAEHLPDLRRLDGFKILLDDAQEQLPRALPALEADSRALEREQQTLEEEAADLRRGGRVRYPAGVESARRLLRERVGWVEAAPLCEWLDIPEAEATWRSAVEAELGTARFDFVIPTQHFGEAVKQFDLFRKQGFPDDRGVACSLYRINFVDVAAIRADRADRLDHGSLAERVEARSADAETYVAYKLGGIACVLSSQELDRRHRRAVTPDLMYRKAYAVSAHDPSRLALYIGEHAREARVEAVRQRLQAIAPELALLQGAYRDLDTLARCVRSLGEQHATFREAVPMARELDARRQKLATHDAEMERLRDAAGLTALVARREELDAELSCLTRAQQEQQGTVHRSHGVRGALEETRDRATTALAAAATECQVKLAGIADGERVAARAAFDREYAQRVVLLVGPTNDRFGDPEAAEWTEKINGLLSTCARQSDEHANAADNEKTAFNRIVQSYQWAHDVGAPPSVTNPAALIAELQRLRHTTLPESEAALARKSLEMRDVVVQEVLHTLAQHFVQVDRLLASINASTEGIETRLGRFKLVAARNPELRAEHALALDLTAVPNFSQLAATSPEADLVQQVNTFLQRLVTNPAERDRLCDYRNYLDFEVHNCPEHGQRFSVFRGTQGGGSGGERQVPFYVMTFALMHHLYESGVTAKQQRGRLLLLDEVFHNMSDDNVRDVMRLAERLGLQLIMVTPGKLRTLAPLFGKTVQVAKRIVDPREPTLFADYARDNLPDDLLEFAEYDGEADADLGTGDEGPSDAAGAAVTVGTA